MAITDNKIVQQTKSPFTADDAGSLAILTRRRPTRSPSQSGWSTRSPSASSPSTSSGESETEEKKRKKRKEREKKRRSREEKKSKHNPRHQRASSQNTSASCSRSNSRGKAGRTPKPRRKNRDTVNIIQEDSFSDSESRMRATRMAEVS